MFINVWMNIVRVYFDYLIPSFGYLVAKTNTVIIVDNSINAIPIPALYFLSPIKDDKKNAKELKNNTKI